MKYRNGWILFALVFLHSSFAQADLSDLRIQQKAALEILARECPLKSDLRRLATEKLGFFRDIDRTVEAGQKEQSFLHLDETSTPRSSTLLELQVLAAAEFSLSAFTSPSYDLRFRKQLIKFLGDAKVASKSTLAALLPLARGLGKVQSREIKWAAEGIIKISERMGPYPSRTKSHPSASYASPWQMLKEEPIESIHNLGGGLNSTLLVTFKNLEKAVFKPLQGEFAYSHGNYDARWINFTREVNIPTIIDTWLGNREARQQGLSTLVVPPTVEVVLAHEGRGYGVGSLQVFEKETLDIEQITKHRKNTWRHLSENPSWKLVENRIRVLDYLVGNYDRLPMDLNGRMFPKNIMVQKENGLEQTSANLERRLRQTAFEKSKIFLIDNGLGMSWEPQFDIQSLGHFPLRQDIPLDLAEIILHFNEEAFREEFREALPDFGLEDFINRLHFAQDRLRYGP